MRRLSLLYSFPFRVGVSGIGHTAWSQIDAVARHGVEVYLRCGSLERSLPRLAGLNETFSFAGRRLPMGPLGIRRAARLHDRLTAQALARGKLQVDAIHGWPLGSELTFQVARRLGIPTFLERPNAHTAYAYGVVMAEYQRLGLAQPPTMTHTMDAARLAVELREYVLADAILCPSDFVAATFRANGFCDEVLLSTQYGYDPKVFRPGPARSLTPGLHLLFAGSAEPRKGLHYALDAWLASSAREHGRLVICGRFSEGYREYLGKALADPSITVAGFTPDMPRMYQEADALVLPSIEEGSALVTYEAMACGAALLVSDATGAHVTHEVEALVAPVRDWRRLSDQMTRLANDRPFLAELRANALRRSSTLTWDHAGVALAAAYRQRTIGG